MSLLARDLGRWEAGEMALAQVEFDHPAAEVGALADLYGRLAALGEQTVPDPEFSWSALRERLGDRPVSLPQRSRRRVVRPAVIALAAVVATGTVAYAAGVEPVRQAVDRAWDAVTGLFDGDHEPGPSRDGGGAELDPEAGEPAAGGGHGPTGGLATDRQVRGSGDGSHGEAGGGDQNGSHHHDAAGGGPGTLEDQHGEAGGGGHMEESEDPEGAEETESDHEDQGDQEPPPEADDPPDDPPEGSGGDGFQLTDGSEGEGGS